RGDGQVDQLGNTLDLMKNAVDAEADVGVLPLRLDVDVRGPRVVGVLQKEIDGVDNMRVADLDIRPRFQLHVLFEVAEVDAALEVALRLGHRGAEAVLLVDHAHHVALRGDDEVDFLFHHLVKRVEGNRVKRVDDGDDQLPVAHGDGDHPVFACKGAGDLGLDHLHVELQRIDLEE